MHRNISSSRRPPKPVARRRRRTSSSGNQPIGRAGASAQRTSTARKAALLSCTALLLLIYFNSKPASPVVENSGRGGGGGGGGGGGVGGGRRGVGGGGGTVFNNNEIEDGNGSHSMGHVVEDPEAFEAWNGTVMPGDMEKWKNMAGWGDIPLAELEDWAPLGPDPKGSFPRTTAKPQAQPTVLVGWGFGAQQLTLYTYRALESILHVYPAAKVKFITIGPQYAYFYKWANILSLTQFQKYSKRGYDVEVEIYSGRLQQSIMAEGKFIPGYKWWQRHEKDLLYGDRMPIGAFQSVKDALPDTYVTIYLALLELYKSGGIYVDLTTFFVRPLPRGLDGFVAGGEGPASSGNEGDCSRPTSGNRSQRPFVMQYNAPKHPVVVCALTEYDQEVSVMNECVAQSRTDGTGGMGCVLETLERCTKLAGLKNDLREAGVVEWHGCSDEAALGYARAPSTGYTGADTLEAIAAIPPRVLPEPAQSETGDPNTNAAITSPTDASSRPVASSNGGSGAGGADGSQDTERKDGSENVLDSAELVVPSADDNAQDGGKGDDEEVKAKTTTTSSSENSGNQENLAKQSQSNSEPEIAEEQVEVQGEVVEKDEEIKEKLAASATDDGEAQAADGVGVDSVEEGNEGSDGRPDMPEVLAEAGIGGGGDMGEDLEERSETGEEEVVEEKEDGLMKEKLAASATDDGEGQGGGVGGGDSVEEGNEGSDNRPAQEAMGERDMPEVLAEAGIGGEGEMGAGLEERSEEMEEVAEEGEEDVNGKLAASATEIGEVQEAESGGGDSEEGNKQGSDGRSAQEAVEERDMPTVLAEAGIGGGGEMGTDLEERSEEGQEEVVKEDEEMKEKLAASATDDGEGQGGGVGGGDSVEEGNEVSNGQFAQEAVEERDMPQVLAEAGIVGGGEMDAGLEERSEEEVEDGQEEENEESEEKEKDEEMNEKLAASATDDGEAQEGGVKVGDGEGGGEGSDGRAAKEPVEEQDMPEVLAEAGIVGEERMGEDLEERYEEMNEKLAASATDDNENQGGGLDGGDSRTGEHEVRGGEPAQEAVEERDMPEVLADAGIGGGGDLDADLEERSEEQEGEEQEEEERQESGDVAVGGGEDGHGGGGSGGGADGSDDNANALEASHEHGDDDSEGHGERETPAEYGVDGVEDASHDKDNDDTADRRESPQDAVGVDLQEEEGKEKEHFFSAANPVSADAFIASVSRRHSMRSLASNPDEANGDGIGSFGEEAEGVLAHRSSQKDHGDNGNSNGSVHPDALLDGSTDVSRALVETGGLRSGSGMAATGAEQVSLVWMGSAGSDGLWREPEEGSLWDEAFSRLRLTRWKPQHVSSSCRIPCGRWDTLSRLGSTAPEAAKAQAGFQCAPRVFVPGTQKGASTFLFHAIAWHPQMVQPLRGAHGFKETGRYVPGMALGPDNLGLRLAAFPFVEEHENLASGDGTVIYMLNGKVVPRAILADNPHAKIVFALRDPIARAWSDFRFMWGIYKKTGGFPSVIDESLEQLSACFDGLIDDDLQPFDFGNGGPGQMTVTPNDEEAINKFYSACTHTQDAGHLVRKGIYYYQVLHWVRVFGRDNVMVVDSADLKSRPKETILDVYRFLGLCPADVSKLEPENVTHSPNIPDNMKIDAKTFDALREFYAPFNKKLYKLLGRDLGWEKNTFTSKRRRR